MKRFYFIILLSSISLIASSLLAQEKTFMQRISLEAGGGYNLPVSPSSDGASLSDYAGFRSFYVGANYELTNLAGLRFTYGNNAFEDTNNSSMGVTHHKFIAEGTFNLLQSIQKNQSPFDIMLHGGLGLSFGKSKQTSGTDKMGTLQIGLMPKYHITDNFSVLLDATYVINLKQSFIFDGGSMPTSGDTGHFLMVNAGISYSW